MVALGRVLVVLGVAVWPVWGVLFLSGSAPNVAYALLAHLALVVPGGVLVRRAGPPGPRPARKRLGDLLIILGVLAWVPYFILREMGVDVPSTPFLVWHLLGVVPGAILRYTRWGAHWFAGGSGASSPPEDSYASSGPASGPPGVKGDGEGAESRADYP